MRIFTQNEPPKNGLTSDQVGRRNLENKRRVGMTCLSVIQEACGLVDSRTQIIEEISRYFQSQYNCPMNGWSWAFFVSHPVTGSPCPHQDVELRVILISHEYEYIKILHKSLSYLSQYTKTANKGSFFGVLLHSVTSFFP